MARLLRRKKVRDQTKLIHKHMRLVLSEEELRRAGGEIVFCPMLTEKEVMSSKKENIVHSWVYASVYSLLPGSFARFLKKNSDKLFAFAIKQQSWYFEKIDIVIAPRSSTNLIQFHVRDELGRVDVNSGGFGDCAIVSINNSLLGDTYDISLYSEHKEDMLVDGICDVLDWSRCDVFYPCFWRARKDFKLLEQQIEKFIIKKPLVV